MAGKATSRCRYWRSSATKSSTSTSDSAMPEGVRERAFARGVATAVHGKIGLHPEKVRGVGKQRKLLRVRVATVQPRSFGFGPPALHELALSGFALGGLVELERLRWCCPLVDDLAHGLDHGHWRLGLEDVAAHVHAGCPLRDRGVGHLQRFQLGQLLARSEEHTSELQSPCNLVCRLL